MATMSSSNTKPPKNKWRTFLRAVGIHQSRSMADPMLSPSIGSPSSSLPSLLWHSFGFAVNIIGVYSHWMFYHTRFYDDFGGRFQYLTYIATHVSLLATGFSTLVDLVQLLTETTDHIHDASNKSRRSVFLLIRDQLMTLYVFCTGVFSAVMYVVIAVVDLEGIHPKEIQSVIPLYGWFNFYIHIFPFVYNILALCIVNYRYKPVTEDIVSILISCIMYWIWISIARWKNGSWAYGFLDKLSGLQLAMFMFLCMYMMCGIYLCGRKVSVFVWSKERRMRYLIHSKSE